MRGFSRSERVSELIKKKLSDILQKHIKDPRLEMATITEVTLSKDLRHAKIYFSIFGELKNRLEAIEGFKSSTGFIKRELGRDLGLRYMPDLVFLYDESLDYGSHIDEVLKSIDKSHESDNRPVENQ